MRFSRLYVKTLKETPKDAEVVSHQLMMRSGMIKKLTSGVYTHLPLGYKVLKKVENIVREEMERAGAQEILMPVIQPAELWQESGRWDTMGPEMMRIKDRHNRDFILGPTHEEVITDIIRNDISSYKSLPLNLFQVQTKFRDERRPRFGLMRCKEFLMKDGYSFHDGEKSLDEEFETMKATYTRIFERCGLNFRAVDADAGSIGGSGSNEFHVLADSGEDEILYCDSCDYGANLEKAESDLGLKPREGELFEPVLTETPNISKIDDLVEHLDIDIKKTVKAMMYKDIDTDKVYMALIRGDFEVNETKLKNFVGAKQDLELLTDEELEELNLVKGYIGPFGMDLGDITVIADKTVTGIANHTAGGNKADTHYFNLNLGKDYKVKKVADIRNVKVGEGCPKCGASLKSARGIEVGHIFKLGDKYSKSLGANYLDQNGKSKDMLMGCYGIGVSRTVAATIEQHNDEFGIIWPMSLAPYTVDVIPANMKDKDQSSLAEKIYGELKDKSIDAIIDDRNERPGFKFKDADLIGFPIKIIVGRGAKDGLVEVKIRKTNEAFEVKIEEVISFVEDLIAKG
ncbi:MAG: proline--tRNA ligase [Psychrilyobacter sp.]|nr:proline--tRNA ligase [Psychrilyobacter sp.]